MKDTLADDDGQLARLISGDAWDGAHCLTVNVRVDQQSHATAMSILANNLAENFIRVRLE